MAARIGHDIDRRTATKHLATHHVDAAVVEIGIGLRLVAPVMHAMLVHLSHAKRNGDERIDVAPAGFKEKHPHLWIFAEAVREHAARRSAAHDYVIEYTPVHRLLLFSS